MDMNYEYYVQKHDVSPKSLEKFNNDYDEDDDELQEQLNSMGTLGWELCGIIHHMSDPDNAKFVYKRALVLEAKKRNALIKKCRHVFEWREFFHDGGGKYERCIKCHLHK